MRIDCVWEHNGGDTLLYAVEYVGAYARGESPEIAIGKLPGEIACYMRWLGMPAPERVEAVIVQDAPSGLKIADADSDVIFDAERGELEEVDYLRLKALAMRSAKDFYALYTSVPDVECSALEQRDTFYGSRPRTAREMYEHTRNVNAYYFGEIGAAADNEGSIIECRRRGFEQLEQKPDFLLNKVSEGSGGELWSLKKLLRRFIWHDRIHAKAMYRMAEKTFGPGTVADPFEFRNM